MKPFVNYRVYIGIVQTGYLDQQKISDQIREGIIYCHAATELETLKPKQILVKPRFMILDESISKNSCTHPFIIESSLKHISEFSPHSNQKVLLERNQYNIANNEFTEKLNYSKFPLLYEEDTEQVNYIYTKDYKSKFHKCLATSQWLHSNYNVFIPKIMGDSQSEGFAGAVRLGLDNSLINYEPDQISQFLEIAFPNLIIGDGIYLPIAGNRSTQRSQELGLILIANNPIAHDIVAATIMNLDPSKIQHLSKSISLGWGPESINEIELGGAGENGLKLLTQKTRNYRSSTFSLLNIKSKYEYENPGLKFPFELLINPENKKQKLLSNILLDSISTAMDAIQTKSKLSKWPKWTVCVGVLQKYPRNNTILCLDQDSLNSVLTLSSQILKKYKLFRIEYHHLMLKNGENYLAIFFDLNKINPYLSLAFKFLIISFARIRLPILKLKTLLRILKTKSLPIVSDKVILTSTLPHNDWWTYVKNFKKEHQTNADT